MSDYEFDDTSPQETEWLPFIVILTQACYSIKDAFKLSLHNGYKSGSCVMLDLIVQRERIEWIWFH